MHHFNYMQLVVLLGIWSSVLVLYNEVEMAVQKQTAIGIIIIVLVMIFQCEAQNECSWK